jgi:hypothetical protein
MSVIVAGSAKPAEPLLTEYMAATEAALDEAYSEPAADVRG